MCHNRVDPMSALPSHLLAQISDALAAQVANAAPWVTAIRIGGNRHVSGIIWGADMVVTSDQALPALDSYSVSVSNGALLPGRVARRDPAANLVCLSLGTLATTTPLPAATNPAVGALALALGAAADGQPTVRLTVIHRVGPGLASGGGPLSDAIMLDLPPNLLPEGGPVLDARGALLGMACAGPHGEALVVPHATIAQFLHAIDMVRTSPTVQGRRGWLGVTLQPIMVPEALRARAGQHSGRMVVSITPGGPAELAGLRLGDVLLAIDGQSVSGQHGLRSFVGADRVGSSVDLRLIRDGTVRNTALTIAPLPER
jgi:S1-C subfamily serine protease